MKPKITIFRVPVRHAAPQAVRISSALGWLYGKAIRGDNGAVRIGYPAIASREKYAGYVTPPQIFTGYSATRVASGSIRATPPALPSPTTPLSVSGSPLVQAMATVTAGQMSKAGR